MSRRFLLYSIATLVLLTALPVGSPQAESEVVLRVDGIVDPTACDPAALFLYCFESTEGDAATAFAAGSSVRVALTSRDVQGSGQGAPHSLSVIAAEQADELAVDTDAGAAIASSDIAEAGDEVFLDFVVPASGTLYFWCDVADHELLGMRFSAEIQPADEPENETEENETDGGDGSDGNTTDGADGNTTDGTDGDVGDDVGGADGGSGDGSGDGSGGDGNNTGDGEGADGVNEESPLPLAPVLFALGGTAYAVRRARGRSGGER